MEESHNEISEEPMEEEDIQEAEESNENQEVYLPDKPLEEGEELICDQSAYIMLHQLKTGAPCLSFDCIPDNLGENRETFPMSMYLVSGSQASQSHMNSVILMKLSNLHKTYKQEDEESSDEDTDDEDGEEKKPKMAVITMKHHGCVNRIRSTRINDTVVAATWSELAKVNIWNLTQPLQIINDDKLLEKYHKDNTGSTATPMFTFTGHQREGYAMDWCNTQTGVLATGDCKKDIHIWHPADGGTWRIDQKPLVGHTDSVEDLQWSPNERCVLASCSVDRSIRVWDTRAPATKACMITCSSAHDNEINVINWNKQEPFIVSGGDDGFLKVWDLRQFQNKSPVAVFKHHTAPVTSVEWHQTDSAVFASAGADNQVALWDLSVEKDDEKDSGEVEGIPPQLLFIHQGQTEIKEIHWHTQLPGVIISTAQSGFNIFRTISV